MNRAKVFSLAVVAVVLSTALVGVGYSAFHATYESSNNTITVGAVTALSLGKNSNGNIQEATNGSFNCDLTLNSVTTMTNTTYSFNSSGTDTAYILDAYAFQKLSGASAATGKLTLTIDTPGMNWSSVQQQSMTIKANTANSNSVTLENGKITIVWNSVTIPAYAASPTTSDGLHLEVKITATQMGNLSYTSPVCNTMKITALLE